MTYSITAVSEDLKPDVNYADPALIDAFLVDVLDDRTLADVRKRLRATDERAMADPRELLPPCMRWTAAGHRLLERLTAATERPTLARHLVGVGEIRRLPGATPTIADLLLSREGGDTVDLTDPRLSAVARYLGPSSGLYTTVVEWTTEAEDRGTRRYLVARGSDVPQILSTEPTYSPLPEHYCGG